MGWRVFLFAINLKQLTRFEINRSDKQKHSGIHNKVAVNMYNENVLLPLCKRTGEHGTNTLSTFRVADFDSLFLYLPLCVRAIKLS